MATPAFLRYLPARLKPLSSPLVWGPLTVLCLLSIFVWEYRRNPDWSNRQPVTDLDVDADGTTLSPEEQAGLSEIDTLDVLLDSIRLPGGNADVEASAPLSSANSPQPTDSTDPFGIYTREYAFPSASPNASGTSSGSAARPSSPSPRRLAGTDLNGILPETPSPATSSALSDALDRQAAQPSVPSSSAPDSAPAQRNRTIPDSSGSQGTQPNQAVVPQAAGTSGSISVPYIRTTPNMSPPVGTTGYQPPATSTLPVFNQPLPLPSRNPYSPAPAPAAQPTLPGVVSQPGISYTPPSSTQPDQNRRVR